MFKPPAVKRDNDPRLQPLRDVLAIVKPPYCAGTINVNESKLVLFYGNSKGDAGRIDMQKASEEELNRLSEACDPATFGLDQEDVLDLSYRKAGKLDSQHFATRLDLKSCGLMDIVRYGLLEGKQGTWGFHAELYKLNVYDKGAFFKAHKDTPRGQAMFGTLVIVFPTEHEGGVLLLRHGSEEWSVDAGRLLAQKKSENPNQPCVAFATFFGDVEHEVTPVVSGYRVTLTYNLYFESTSKMETEPPHQVTAQTIPAEITEFKSALSNLLADSTFLPEGGSIGFGLYHQYPIMRESKSLEGLDECLKGRDAMIMQVCKELDLNANLWLLYDDRDSEAHILSKTVLDVDSTDEYTFLSFVLQRKFDVRVAKPSKFANDHPCRDERKSNVITWINKISGLNGIKTQHAAYGNEVFMACTYAFVCLIVDIGAPGRRTEIQGEPEEKSDSESYD